MKLLTRNWKKNRRKEGRVGAIRHQGLVDIAARLARSGRPSGVRLRSDPIRSYHATGSVSDRDLRSAHQWRRQSDPTNARIARTLRRKRGEPDSEIKTRRMAARRWRNRSYWQPRQAGRWIPIESPACRRGVSERRNPRGPAAFDCG